MPSNQGIPNLVGFEIVKEGIISISKLPGASTSTSGIVNHNLGYQPAFVAYLASGGSLYAQLPYISTNLSNGTTPGNVESIYNVVVTSTQVLAAINAISNNAWSTAASADIKYFLLRETIT